MGLVNEKFLKNENVDTLKGDASNAIAEVIEYKANSIKINTASDEARLMVTSEVFYPGWNVYIDGKKASLLEVNYAYKGVIIPEGMHEVELVYQPPLWKDVYKRQALYWMHMRWRILLITWSGRCWEFPAAIRISMRQPLAVLIL